MIVRTVILSPKKDEMIRTAVITRVTIPAPFRIGVAALCPPTHPSSDFFVSGVRIPIAEFLEIVPDVASLVMVRHSPLIAKRPTEAITANGTSIMRLSFGVYRNGSRLKNFVNAQLSV